MFVASIRTPCGDLQTFRPWFSRGSSIVGSDLVAPSCRDDAGVISISMMEFPRRISEVCLFSFVGCNKGRPNLKEEIPDDKHLQEGPDVTQAGQYHDDDNHRDLD